MSEPWWQIDQRRTSYELYLLRGATNARVQRDGDLLLFDEDLSVSGLRFSLRFYYPRDFPYSPIRAYPRSPRVPHLEAIHVFTDGSLCLHDPSEWLPTRTGLWIRNRAVAWCTALERFSRTGQWEPITH
jgi:hypothetical protein